MTYPRDYLKQTPAETAEKKKAKSVAARRKTRQEQLEAYRREFGTVPRECAYTRLHPGHRRGRGVHCSACERDDFATHRLLNGDGKAPGFDPTSLPRGYHLDSLRPLDEWAEDFRNALHRALHDQHGGPGRYARGY